MRLTFQLQTALTGMNDVIKRILALLVIAGIVSASAATNDVVEGNPFSPVKVTIYSDLQCDYCQTLRTLLDEKLLPKYGAQVAFIHRDLPLGRHDWARTAALVARWVDEQDPKLGTNFRRELLAEHLHVTRATLQPWIVEFARRNKLSEKEIVAAMTDPRLGTLVDRDAQLAATRSINKIPTVIVAGQSFAEIIIYDDVARVIDQALAR
jgi:protein-disulfide isomerase